MRNFTAILNNFTVQIFFSKNPYKLENFPRDHLPHTNYFEHAKSAKQIINFFQRFFIIWKN